MMSTDATEDDMDLARTEEADLDPPECSGIVEVKKCTRLLSLCLIGGAGGGKGGWEGTETSLIVIKKKMAEVFLVCTAFRWAPPSERWATAKDGR